jgi:transcriptional regulator with XRE-family HTH domain
MRFEQLLNRLLCHVRLKVHNGEITERGFARQIGFSQSHIHNVLSGARILTASTADRILDGLGLTLTDLLNDQELVKKPPGHSRKAASRPGVRRAL